MGYGITRKDFAKDSTGRYVVIEKHIRDTGITDGEYAKYIVGGLGPGEKGYLKNIYFKHTKNSDAVVANKMKFYAYWLEPNGDPDDPGDWEALISTDVPMTLDIDDDDNTYKKAVLLDAGQDKFLGKKNGEGLFSITNEFVNTPANMVDIWVRIEVYVPK